MKLEEFLGINKLDTLTEKEQIIQQLPDTIDECIAALGGQQPMTLVITPNVATFLADIIRLGMETHLFNKIQKET